MNANKVIHEAIGFKGLQLHRDLVPTYPCYNDSAPYCELMEWMKKEDRWGKFREWFQFCIEDFLNAPRLEQVNLIAEAIKAGVLK